VHSLDVGADDSQSCGGDAVAGERGHVREVAVRAVPEGVAHVRRAATQGQRIVAQGGRAATRGSAIGTAPR
jgi:hypothetical protein